MGQAQPVAQKPNTIGGRIMQNRILGMNQRVLFSLAISFFLARLTTAQTLGRSADLSEEQRLEQRVSQQIDTYEQWKAKLLNNPQRMAQLKKESESSQARRFGSEESGARITLARLGDLDAAEEIACGVYDKDPHVQISSIRDMEEVGGY